MRSGFFLFFSFYGMKVFLSKGVADPKADLLLAAFLSTFFLFRKWKAQREERALLKTILNEIRDLPSLEPRYWQKGAGVTETIPSRTRPS
jgi:hypothetical protein